jgi:hypothetical protein
MSIYPESTTDLNLAEEFLQTAQISEILKAEKPLPIDQARILSSEILELRSALISHAQTKDRNPMLDDKIAELNIVSRMIAGQIVKNIETIPNIIEIVSQNRIILPTSLHKFIAIEDGNNRRSIISTKSEFHYLLPGYSLGYELGLHEIRRIFDKLKPWNRWAIDNRDHDRTYIDRITSPDSFRKPNIIGGGDIEFDYQKNR